MTTYTYTDPGTGEDVEDCDLCIDGHTPATHHILGPGYVRCPQATDGRTCCGLATFYPLTLTTAGVKAAEWATTINRTHHLLPVLCAACGGVVDLYPVTRPRPIRPDGP